MQTEFTYEGVSLVLGCLVKFYSIFSKGDADVKNRLLDSVGEVEGGIIWENSIETYTLSYVKWMTSASLMHEAGHPNPVLSDNQEGYGGKGRRRGGFRIRGTRISSVQFSSVAQLCPTLCDPMNCSTLRLPVHHQLPKVTQTHVHRVGDAIQASHPLSSPSPPASNPSQHQGLFQWVNSSHEVAKVLEFQL